MEGPPTEITPSNTTNNVSNNGTGKDVHNPNAAFVLPYNTDLVEVSRPTSSGQRIKLQVEVNSDYKFLTICDPVTAISFFLSTISHCTRHIHTSSSHIQFTKLILYASYMFFSSISTFLLRYVIS